MGINLHNTVKEGRKEGDGLRKRHGFHFSLLLFKKGSLTFCGEEKDDKVVGLNGGCSPFMINSTLY